MKLNIKAVVIAEAIICGLLFIVCRLTFAVAPETTLAAEKTYDLIWSRVYRPTPLIRVNQSGQAAVEDHLDRVLERATIAGDATSLIKKELSNMPHHDHGVGAPKYRKRCAEIREKSEYF